MFIFYQNVEYLYKQTKKGYFFKKVFDDKA